MGIEQIQKIHEFGEINVIISLLLCAMLVIALKAGWEKLLDVLGLETKASLQKKALEKKLSDMEQKIADLYQCALDTERRNAVAGEHIHQVLAPIQAAATIQELTQSLCDYFGIPLIEAGPVFRGTVVTDGSNLNLRQFPSTQGAVIGSIPNGSVLTVYSRSNGWDVVSYRGTVGYASSEFIVI